MRDLLDSIQRPDIVKSVDGWTQTTVKAEDLILNEGGEREEIEEVGEIFPDIGVAVFSEAFVIKSVDLCDLAGLVVSSKDGDTLGVTDLKANKESDCFDGVVTAVDVVT